MTELDPHMQRLAALQQLMEEMRKTGLDVRGIKGTFETEDGDQHDATIRPDGVEDLYTDPE